MSVIVGFLYAWQSERFGRRTMGGSVPEAGHSAPGLWKPKALPSPTRLPGGIPGCRRAVGKRAVGTSPTTSRQPAGAPGPSQRPGRLRRSPSERTGSLPRPRAPTGRRVAAPGTQCPWRSGQPSHHKGPFVPEAPSDQGHCGPACGLSSLPQPQQAWLGFVEGLLSPVLAHRSSSAYREPRETHSPLSGVGHIHLKMKEKYPG